VLETADGRILMNSKDKPRLRTGSSNTRESYLLENVTHNSLCPPRCKFRASPDARYHSSADWHILQHRESAPHMHPEKQAQVTLCQRIGQQAAWSWQNPPVW